MILTAPNSRAPKEVSSRAKARRSKPRNPRISPAPALPSHREPPPITPSPQPQRRLSLPTSKLSTHASAHWRATEAERLGLPQFFVLGTATLRNIAIERPRTLTELRMIDGVSLEKAEKFGPSILEICSAQ